MASPAASYRGYRAARLDRVRPPGVLEILRAVPPGSRRLLGRHIPRLVLDGAAVHPAISRLRADFRSNVLAVLGQLAARAVWADGTAMLPRERLAAELGISLSTWQRSRRVLKAAGILGTVRPGRRYHDDAGHVRDDAAVYVLCLPKRIMSYLRKKSADRRRAGLSRVTDAPTVSASGSTPSGPRARGGPGDDGAPSGRAHPRGRAARPAAARHAGGPAARALAEVVRQAGGKGITDGWAAWLVRPFAAAGWTPADLATALGYAGWDGRAFRYTGRMRRPGEVLRWRLSHWLGDDGRAAPSPSQRRADRAAASRAEQDRDRAARQAAKAAPPDETRLEELLGPLRAQLAALARARQHP